jgi:hypothetical protein
VATRELGAAGALESSMYVTPDEQPLRLPAASVAVALNVVVESSATATVIPVANVAADALAAGVPVQAGVV